MGDKNQNIESIQSFSEIFKCMICFSDLNDPHVCPQCSKLYCFGCIIEWLNTDSEKTSYCPHCKSYLNYEQLVRIRWLDEVKTVQSVQNQTFTSHIEKVNDDGECSTHDDNKMILYCKTCEKCLCMECLNDDYHLFHNYQNINAVYLMSLQAVEEKIKLFHGRFEKAHEIEAFIDQSITDLATNKSKALEILKTEHEVNQISVKNNVGKLLQLEEEYQMKIVDIETQEAAKVEKLYKEKDKIQKYISEAKQLTKVFEKTKTRSKTFLIKMKGELLSLIVKKYMEPMIDIEELKHEINFRRVTSGSLLITGMQSMPSYGVYSNVVWDYSGNRWRLKVIKTEIGPGLAAYIQMLNSGVCKWV